MREQNGIRIYEEGDILPALPKGLEEFTAKSLFAPYGFKIVEYDGEPYWVPGTEEDFRRSEATRLGIAPDRVEVKIDFSHGPPCAMDRPRHCHSLAHCDFNWRCNRLYDDQNRYYYCRCT